MVTWSAERSLMVSRYNPSAYYTRHSVLLGVFKRNKSVQCDTDQGSGIYHFARSPNKVEELLIC